MRRRLSRSSSRRLWTRKTIVTLGHGGGALRFALPSSALSTSPRVRGVAEPVATPKVVASILTRNRRAVLREALAGVMEQTRPVSDVVVVDNQSTDGTPAMLAEEFPAVRVVALTENQGATGGFYEAIKA